MAITAVAVAGVAASAVAAGTQAYSASQAGKGGGAPAVRYADLHEQLFNRGTVDVLNNERALMQDALAQARFVQPEMYKALGFEPIYDKSNEGAIAASGEKRDSIRAALDANREARIQTKGKPTKKKRLAREADRLNRELTVAERQLGEAQAVGPRVVGLRQSEERPDPTGSKDNLFQVATDLQNQTLVRALKGEEPIDATLKTEYEERERTLRDRLRNSLGSDYESSTAGQSALSNFAREKAESFQRFNSETVRSFSDITNARAGLTSNLTGARLEQLLGPARAQAGFAQALGGTAERRMDYGKFRQAERGLLSNMDERAYNNRQQQNAAEQQRLQGIAGAIGGVGQGLTSFAGGFPQGGGSAGGTIKPTNAVSTSTGASADFPLSQQGGVARALGGVYKLNR